MIFTEQEQEYILGAMSVSIAEMTSRGMTAEVEYVTDRIKEGSNLVDKPYDYLQHLLATFEYIQEVLNA